MSLVRELNALGREAFVARLAGVYEHSPWVAERAFHRRPFASLEAVLAVMQGAVRAASPEEQMALIQAHPELAGKLEAAELTEHSLMEQRGAGLDRCTPEQKAHLQALNQRYREKFGFPFIVAVKGLDWAAITERLEARLANDREAEVAAALEQVGRIAEFRLEAMA
jgi:2-oxo-4-hydroxy-4-carboxy-5-ureidoimidazoline decarboxylase